ncbi:MAG: MlaD family protein [Flavobacteriaceae bacterium]|nr:MlaD family protein [Flavobacteriaceae bacterium]
MSNTAQNFRLGLFVFAGVFIFILAVYFLGNRQNLFGDNVRISSVFKNVNGLQMGNNVRFAGVNVGTVRGITILNDTAINVDMLISEKTAQLIKKNALATITSDGLVGSMIVNIIPNDIFIEERIETGDTISSISKIATADMLTTLNTTNENAALLTQDLLRITNAINKGEGVLGALIKDEALLDDVKKSLSNLQQTTQTAKTSMFELNRIIKEVNFDDNIAGLLLKDTVSVRKLATVFDNLETSSKEIEQLTKNLNAFSETLKTNEGILNYALHDTIAVKNLDATLKNAEEASERLNENMEALKHNFLFRGYFRKLERQEAREERRQN